MKINKIYPRNNSLSLKGMKKRKIDAPIAFMINHLLNFRIFKVSEDLTLEEEIVNKHWNKLEEVTTGPELITWTKELRKIIWGNEQEWNKVYPDLLPEEKLDITKRLVELLGSVVANIILDNSYWINIWNEMKGYDYFNLELQSIANKSYIEEKFPFNSEINEESVIERGEYIKDRFGINSILFAGFYTYSDMFNILLKLEDDLENFTSILDWDETDFGAFKLNIGFGLSLSPKSEYNSLNQIINLNMPGLNNFYEEYFRALDNGIAKNIFNSKSEYESIDIQATNMILDYYEEDFEDLKNIIKEYIKPNLKFYHKHNVKIKLLKMIPKLLETLITPKTSQSVFKAFVDNRKNEYIKWFDKNMKFPNKSSKIKESWGLWKSNTETLIHSELTEIMSENLSISLYLESIIRLVDNLLSDKITWNKSWIVLLSEMEKNMFNAKKDEGIFIQSQPFEPKKSKINELLVKSFNSYVESVCNENEELYFINNTQGNLSYPQGMDKDQEIKWWQKNLNILRDYWI